MNASAALWGEVQIKLRLRIIKGIELHKKPHIDIKNDGGGLENT